MMRAFALLLALTLPSSALAQHPLNGKLWQVSQQRFLTQEELFQQLPAEGWLLLGEQHDNPDHHRLQQDWIEALAQRDQLGAVALEMATHAQQSELDQARGQGHTTTPEALNWNPGWDWTLYGAVVGTALDRAPVVVGADITRAEQRSAYQNGSTQGDAGALHADYMRQLLFSSHCGQLPKASLEGMRQVQLVRDQQMAERLERTHLDGRNGVMLTGSIHARQDLGIPLWFQRPVISVLLTPTEAGHNEPYDYLPESYPNAPAAADYLLFTEAVVQQDYCAELHHRSPPAQ